MPISILDVSNVAPIGDYGNNDIFSNMLKMRESQKAAEDRGLQNEGKRHQNTILGAEAQYAPDKFRFANAIQEAKARYAEEQEQADVQQKLAHAFNLNQHGNYAGGQMPESVRIANALHPSGSDEWKQAIQQLGGMFNEKEMQKIAEEAGIPFEVIAPILGGKNEQTKAVDENLAGEKIASGMIKVTNTVARLRKIMNENPNLSSSFAAILDNPEDRDTVFKRLRAQAVNEKDKAAVEKFSKDTSDLIVGMQEQLPGGVRATDSLRTLWADTKPKYTNTKEANDYLFDKLDEENIGGKEYFDALRFASKHRVRIIHDRELFKKRALEKRSKLPTIGAEQFPENLKQNKPVGQMSDKELQDFFKQENKGK